MKKKIVFLIWEKEKREKRWDLRSDFYSYWIEKKKKYLNKYD